MNGNRISSLSLVGGFTTCCFVSLLTALVILDDEHNSAYLPAG